MLFIVEYFVSVNFVNSSARAITMCVNSHVERIRDDTRQWQSVAISCDLTCSCPKFFPIVLQLDFQIVTHYSFVSYDNHGSFSLSVRKNETSLEFPVS